MLFYRRFASLKITYYVQVDVVLLFTNVPVKKTGNITWKIIYKNKEILAAFGKWVLKKWISNTYQKLNFPLTSFMKSQIELGELHLDKYNSRSEKVIVENLKRNGFVKLDIRWIP